MRDWARLDLLAYNHHVPTLQSLNFVGLAGVGDPRSGGVEHAEDGGLW
jgi:hypothetical protein